MSENPANPNDPTVPRFSGPKRNPKAKKNLYGLSFPPIMDAIEIELYCIRKGGSWKGKQGQTLGMGDFFHYKRLMQLLWPKDAHHRWSDLILEETLRSTILAVLGPRDSGKTHCALTRYALTDYFAFPHNTLILVSSTDVRGLELRVWGDMKNMFKQAKDRYPSLPGHLLDSKHAICTDNLIEGETRDLRKGIICFLAGTQVDTPSGKKSIETIRPGEEVFNAFGIGKVTETQCSIAKELVRVTLSDGRTIDCTPEHPFFTRRGWVYASKLKTYDKVFSIHETLRLLQPTTRTRIPKQKTLLCSLSGQASRKTMRILSGNLQTSKTETKSPATLGKVLQHDVCEPMGGSKWTGTKANDTELRSLWKDLSGPSESNVLHPAVPAASTSKKLRRMRKAFHISDSFKEEQTDEVLRIILQMEKQGPKKRTGPLESYERGTNGRFGIHRNGTSSQSSYGQKNQKKRSAFLRNRHSVPVAETGSRNRWWDSSDSIQAKGGREENRRTEHAWVASVEILKDESSGRTGRCDSGHRVYNLSVDNHPSYSVNGVVVHNCIPCMSSGGSWQGLGKYVGIKQKRRRLLGDESQLMKAGYLDALANLNSGTQTTFNLCQTSLKCQTAH